MSSHGPTVHFRVRVTVRIEIRLKVGIRVRTRIRHLVDDDVGDASEFRITV